MNRAALRFGLLTAVVVLASGTTSAAAFAQDDPASGAAGVLYADKNGNGQQDSGEAVARAERPYSEQLKVYGFFHDNSYFYPTSVTTTLILINTTDRPISGIQARCDRTNAPGALGHGPGWDVLRGEGITLAAGGRRSLTIVDDVPESARTAGKVTLDCDFAPNAGWNTDGPVLHQDAPVIEGRAEFGRDFALAHDWAGVPGGGPGSLNVLVAHDKDEDYVIDPGDAIGNVRVRLMSHRENGFLVAEATTDVWGWARFTEIPLGTYWLKVDGPWKSRVTGMRSASASQATSGGPSAGCCRVLIPHSRTPEISPPPSAQVVVARRWRSPGPAPACSDSRSSVRCSSWRVRR
jgi:hypothetical protein